MTRWIVVAGVAVVVAGSAMLFDPLALLPDADSETTAPVVRERAEVVIADLSTTHEADGELRFAEQREVSVSGGTGTGATLTAIAPLGEAVDGSAVLYEIDGVPTVALIGDVPAWRTMSVNDVGVDVAQLESNLVALGYDPDGALTIDETFTDFTAEVVQRWQEDLGLDVSGSVEFGSVVFVPSDSTVATVVGVVGSAGQGSLMTVASAERELVFPVAGELLDTIDVGMEVSARLPDRSAVTAVVVELAPSGDGSWEAVAEISLDDSEVSLPAGDAIPLTVSWIEAIADGAKTVRANALVRLDSGGYAVEVVATGDADAGDVGPGEVTEFVPVEIGARSGSTVEIIADLDVGAVVIAP